MTEKTEEEIRKELDNDMTAIANSGPLAEQTPVVLAKNKLIAQLARQRDEDFEFTKDTLKALATLGHDAAIELKEIASETMQPFAYKVLADLIKSTGDIAYGVFETRKMKDEMDKQRAPIETNISNSTIFVGTTQDLLNNLSEDPNKGKVIDV